MRLRIIHAPQTPCFSRSILQTFALLALSAINGRIIITSTSMHWGGFEPPLLTLYYNSSAKIYLESCTTRGAVHIPVFCRCDLRQDFTGNSRRPRRSSGNLRKNHAKYLYYYRCCTWDWFTAPPLSPPPPAPCLCPPPPSHPGVTTYSTPQTT